MLLASINRVELLSVLPKGGTVAEVGVNKGAYAAKILRLAEPRRLHLVDPWALDENDAYLEAYRANRPGMLAAFDHVCQLFQGEIGSDRVVIHRGYSTDLARTFAENTFDWVYIDAMHDFESVLADLLAFRDKVKPDGFILGHDFSTFFSARTFGVVPAVREFTKTQGYELVLVTNENNPTYLLARCGNNTTLPALRDALLTSKGCSLVEIEDTLLDLFKQVRIDYPDGRQGRMIRFG